MMDNRVRILTWLIVATLVPILAGCSSEKPLSPAPPPTGPAIAVETAVAGRSEVPTGVEATGSVEPWVRVSPGTKILGRVEEVHVREGDAVRKGALLARLERRDLEASVAQARAAIAMAEAELDKARAQKRRMEQLHERGSVTDKNLEDSRAGFLVSEAAVAQARANLAAEEVTLSYAEIHAPRSGFVTAKHVEAGDMAQPGAPMFVIEDLSSAKVVVGVPESAVVGMTAGDPASIRIDVLERDIEATVDRVVPSGDPASRTFDVQLRVENPDGELKTGMFVRARFERGSRSTLTVPRSALVERGQLKGLFVVENGKALLRWIRLGREHDDRVEVLAGLEDGDRFVTSPPKNLVDGAAVDAG